MAVELPENDEEGPEKDGERWDESSISITTSQLHKPTFQQLPQLFVTQTILK